MEIHSRQNRKLRRVRELHHPQERREQGCLVLEGERVLSAALEAQLDIFEVFHVAAALRREKSAALLHQLEGRGSELFLLDEPLMDYISPSRSAPGILAVGQLPEPQPLERLLHPKAGLVILEGISSPGNLGAVLRATLALGGSGVVILEGSVDLFHPRAIHGSAGAVFGLPAAWGVSRTLLLEKLAASGIPLLVAHPRAARTVDEYPFQRPWALALGEEAHGISPEMLSAAAEKVCIPMEPGVESLNLATAAAVILDAARRAENRTNARLSII